MGGQVTRTLEGSGASATRTRRTIPRAGPMDRYASPGARWRRQRFDAAVGRDGVTQEPYGQALEATLRALQARLQAKRDRHQPIRRVHSPKAQGTTRPMGMSAFEDNVVHDAVRAGLDRKSTRLNSSHIQKSRMPSSA